MKLTSKQWSSYWDSSTLTTFHGNFENNYDGTIREFWDDCFGCLTDEAGIIDLGTGNGALALLAAEYAEAHQKRFTITGIDYADINPARHRSDSPGLQTLLDGIEFLSNRTIEATGLADGAAELVMSQFGFEYAETRDAVDEVNRVNRSSGGRFAAMLHHRDSAILHQADEAVKQIRMCDHSELLTLARELIRFQHAAKQQGRLDQKRRVRAEKCSKKFSSRLERLKASRKQFQQPGHLDFFINNLMALFNQKHGLTKSEPVRLEIVDRIGHAGRDYMQRMQDLQSAAVDDAKLRHIGVLFERYNYKEISIEPVYYQGQLFCKSLTTQR